MSTHVSRIPAAPSAEALTHFTERLSFETDCWDVHATISDGKQDFVLLDVRGPVAYEKGHLPGAVHLPHWEITEETLAQFPNDALYVVYCAGPHCNGANRGAIELALLGRPVKEMIGGVTGWLDEGFELVRDDAGNAERSPCSAELATAGPALQHQGA